MPLCIKFQKIPFLIFPFSVTEKMLQGSTSSSRAPEDQTMFAPTRMDIEAGGAHLPVYSRREGYFSWGSKLLVHSIPVIVLLSIFILCWFSYPVNLVIKDGIIEAIIRADRPLLLEDTNHVEFAILASASPPITTIPEELTIDTEAAEIYPVGQIG